MSDRRPAGLGAGPAINQDRQMKWPPGVGSHSSSSSIGSLAAPEQH